MLNPENDTPQAPPSQFSQPIIPEFKLNKEELWGEGGFSHHHQCSEASADISPIKLSRRKRSAKQKSEPDSRQQLKRKVTILRFFKRVIGEAQILLN